MTTTTPFETLASLPIPIANTQCVIHKYEVLICGSFYNDVCYSYHTVKDQYKQICVYPTNIRLRGHSVVKLVNNNDSNDITLLSFGGDHKHTLVMKYISVWEDENRIKKTQNANQWVPWIDANNKKISIGRLQDDYYGVRAVIGGSNNNLLFITYCPNNIDVFDLNALKYIKHSNLPNESASIYYHCFVSTTDSDKDKNQMLLFCYKTGLSIEYNEDTNTFSFQKLPVCSALFSFNRYGYVRICDAILFFGGNNENKNNALKTIYSYSITRNKWKKLEYILPMPLSYCFVTLNADNTYVHIIGGFNGKRDLSTHIKINIDKWLRVDLDIKRMVDEVELKMEREEEKWINEEKFGFQPKELEQKKQRNEKIIKTFDREKYEKDIQSGTKPHLEKLKLDNKQLKTLYALDYQLVEMKFYLSEKEVYNIPIDFTYTFAVMDEMINEKMTTKLDFTKKQFVYKIGSRDIPRTCYSFVQCVFEALAQQNDFIDYPLHIHVAIHDRQAVATPVKQDQVSLTSMKKALHLPKKAIVPTFVKLYPLQTFQQVQKSNTSSLTSLERDSLKENKEEEEREKKKSMKIIEDVLHWQLNSTSNEKTEFRIGTRIKIEIPLELRSLPFRIQSIEAHECDNSYENDFRVKIIYPIIDCIDDPDILNKHITKKDKEKNNKPIKFGTPLVIHWKLQSNSKREFKAYWYWHEVRRWFADSQRVGVVETTKGQEWLQVKVFGYYDIWIREQIHFLGHWVDRSIFNEKFHRDYTHLSEEDKKPFQRGKRLYHLPQGWKRYSLNVRGWYNKNICLNSQSPQTQEDDIEKWCVGYHGTDMQFLPSLLRDHLVTPGTVLSMSGRQLSIPDGHIKTIKPLYGDDQFTNNVFLSPCINYSTHPAYLKSTQLDPSLNKYFNLILMVRVRPSSIKENQETIGWKGIGRLDPLYSNDEMEWRVRDPKDCVIYGLLVKESKLAMDNNNAHLCRDIFELEKMIYLNFIFYLHLKTHNVKRDYMQLKVGKKKDTSNVIINCLLYCKM
ncbi:hypothetical protein RFI_02503 [Reticulomyxa filosa]|uniref:Uncharacterized protein n=1 Tax=Reticulomyxa filosa TaxID=46433 RepID=X6P8Z8_RETFI|nr:hypothetical protein RFI_02503 [Reticulomyxa filosa]|eukprot:ETO34588.1 hypothetical protein RFI_02503 [Reticulomyxa filosa]